MAELMDELNQRIVQKVEYQLSDQHNLLKDYLLMKAICLQLVAGLV
jgi:hypothetical protein